MKIKTKYIGSIYLTVLLFSVTAIGLAFYLNKLTSKSINSVLECQNELELLSKLELAIDKSLMPANDYLIHGDEFERYTFADHDAEVNRLFTFLEGKYYPTRIMKWGQDQLNNLKGQYAIVRTLSEGILNLSDLIGNVEGAQLMEEMDLLVDDVLEDANVLHRSLRLEILRQIEVIDDHFNKYIFTVLSLLLIGAMVSLFYERFLTKGIIVPLGHLVEHMGFVAKGDFSQKYDIKTKDEIGVLAERYNWMAQKLTISRDTVKEYSNKLEVTVKERTKELTSARGKLEEKIDELKISHIHIVEALVISVETRDRYTRGHSERVTHFAKIIAEAMGLTKDNIVNIELAARLHDIGKIGISDNILQKNGKLTVTEWEEMKTHPVKGAEMIRFADFFKPLVPIVKHHHENHDGTGYPDGLKGDDTPVGSRIIHVVDAFDAMTSDRTYRKTMEVDEVIKIMTENEKLSFDPEIIKIWFKFVHQFKELKAEDWKSDYYRIGKNA